jgi:hypothetical protein
MMTVAALIRNSELRCANMITDFSSDNRVDKILEFIINLCDETTHTAINKDGRYPESTLASTRLCEAVPLENTTVKTKHG